MIEITLRSTVQDQDGIVPVVIEVSNGSSFSADDFGHLHVHDASGKRVAMAAAREWVTVCYVSTEREWGSHHVDGNK